MSDLAANLLEAAWVLRWVLVYALVSLVVALLLGRMIARADDYVPTPEGDVEANRAEATRLTLAFLTDDEAQWEVELAAHRKRVK